jgi:hypothetical protein
MKKWLVLGLFIVLLTTLTGCSIVDALLGNVNGYDLTACGHYPSACWELAWDNRDKLNTGAVLP